VENPISAHATLCGRARGCVRLRKSRPKSKPDSLSERRTLHTPLPLLPSLLATRSCLPHLQVLPRPHGKHQGFAVLYVRCLGHNRNFSDRGDVCGLVTALVVLPRLSLPVYMVYLVSLASQAAHISIACLAIVIDLYPPPSLDPQSQLSQPTTWSQHEARHLKSPCSHLG